MHSRWYSISFSFQLACHILNLADKHGITLIPAYIPIHPNEKAIMMKAGTRMASYSSHNSSGISTLISTGGRCVSILIYQPISALFHLGRSTTSGSLWVACIQSSLNMTDELCISSLFLSFHTSIQVSGRTCHGSLIKF